MHNDRIIFTMVITDKKTQIRADQESKYINNGATPIKFQIDRPPRLRKLMAIISTFISPDHWSAFDLLIQYSQSPGHRGPSHLQALTIRFSLAYLCTFPDFGSPRTITFTSPDHRSSTGLPNLYAKISGHSTVVTFAPNEENSARKCTVAISFLQIINN